MPAPYNYYTPQQSPLMTGLKGFEMAQQQRARAQQMAMQQAEMQRAQQEAEAKRQRQMQFQQDLQSYLDKPNRTAKDTLDFLARNPTFAKPFGEIQNMVGEEKRKNILGQAQNTLFALQGGNIDAARNIIEQNKQAAINSGDKQAAQRFDILLQNLDDNPDSVKENLNFLIAESLGPEKYTEFIAKTEEIRAGRAMEPGKIRKQELENKKLDFELKKLEKKAETPGDAIFDQEAKIRSEYDKKAKNYTEAYESYERLRLGAEADTGQGDLALITGFMKMLDPGSVVRETEFANAQDTSGIWNRVKNMVSKWKEGDRLQPEDRKRFLDLSRQYMQAAADKDSQVRAGYDKLVSDYGLDKERIFGPQFKITESGAQEQPEKKESPAAKKEIIQTGTYQGRKVNKYSDGSIEYAD